MRTLTNTVLMQYQTPLPADTDISKIRSRVSELAPIFDRLPGLHFKLYGLNEPETAAFAEYSSIYLWNGLESMQDYVSGDLFDNYSSVFARPPVRWYLVHSINGDFASVRIARFAIRRIAPFPRRVHVGAILSDWEARFRRDGAIMQIIGFDPASWEIIDLSIWEKRPDIGDLDHRYTLVRTSGEYMESSNETK